MGFGIFRQQGFETPRGTPLSSLKNE